MPKIPKSQEDRDLMREKILDEALSLISEKGFQSFSMRKLASRLGMSATSIYNYYSNKDDLYLMVLTRGFDMLFKMLSEIYETPCDPGLKVGKMVEAYIDFGIRKAHYYNIMFTSDTPKYRDYIGTDIEPTAYFEKQTALKLFDITSRALRDMDPGMKALSPENVRHLVIKIWSTLHGIISLYNSRVLPEVDDNPEQVIERIARDLLEPFIAKGKSDC